jgi:uncharacterized protein YbaP (TraB family)
MNLRFKTLFGLTIIAFVTTGLACKKSEADAASVALAKEGKVKAPKIQPTKKPFLWKIEGKKTSWLFGTIHLPDERVLAIPKPVLSAVDSCDVMNTEIPMDFATQLSMAPRMLIGGGKTVKDLIPKPLYARVEKLFTEKKVPMFPLNQMKLWAMTTQIAILDHIKKFQTAKPIDMVLYNRAQSAGKQVGGLETIAEQLSVFEELTLAEQIQMLEQTLDLLDEFKKKGEDPVEEMLLAYLAGDSKKMLAAMLESYDPENALDKKVMKRLFFDRNVRMADRIADKIKLAPDKGFFFAVGAGHLLGDEGMVRLLEKKGYKLKRILAP